MGAAALLAALRADGFTLSLDGDHLLVAPSARLSESYRTQIRQHKPALVSLLCAGTLQTVEGGAHEAANDLGAPVVPEAGAKRLARFYAIGLDEDAAERLALRLARRDEEGDDRRVCAECSHFSESGRCIAAAVGRLPWADRRLEPEPDRLQRCEGFGLRKELP